MKIIFLDIDGVLNSEEWYISIEHSKLDKESTEDWKKSNFDPKCIDKLHTIAIMTGAKFVVSSSWRLGRSVESIKNLFKYVGFKGDIIDKTPLLTFNISDGLKYNYSVPRGCEIKAWLELNKDILGQKLSKTRYAILDDDSDMLYWQRDSYFKVDRKHGITQDIVEKVIKHLNHEP